MDIGLFLSQAQQYLVTLSRELRSAYSSIRALVPPKQRLLFSITALLSYKGVFSTTLQSWPCPSKSSFSLSSDQHQHGLQEVGINNVHPKKTHYKLFKTFKPLRACQPLNFTEELLKEPQEFLILWQTKVLPDSLLPLCCL